MPPRNASRLERDNVLVLQFRQDLRQLLTAQVLLQDRVSQLTEAQKHTDESLHALINIVDGIIRKPPQ